MRTTGTVSHVYKLYNFNWYVFTQFRRRASKSQPWPFSNAFTTRKNLYQEKKVMVSLISFQRSFQWANSRFRESIPWRPMMRYAMDGNYFILAVAVPWKNSSDGVFVTRTYRAGYIAAVEKKYYNTMIIWPTKDRKEDKIRFYKSIVWSFKNFTNNIILHNYEECVYYRHFFHSTCL